MDDAKTALVRIWLTKAVRDLLTANRAAVEPDGLLDTAVFHCQQAAEKAIKGFLVWHDIRFEKTHNLGALLKLAMGKAPAFSQHEHSAVLLTPYATLYRYPGDLIAPNRQEYEQARVAAESLLKFVQSLLPESTTPLG